MSHAPAAHTRDLIVAEIIARGRVQGVGFRFWVTQEAEPRGVTGEARNLPDGTVHVTAEGEEWAVDELIGCLRSGRTPGHVAHLSVVRRPLADRSADDFRAA